MYFTSLVRVEARKLGLEPTFKVSKGLRLTAPSRKKTIKIILEVRHKRERVATVNGIDDMLGAGCRC